MTTVAVVALETRTGAETTVARVAVKTTALKCSDGHTSWKCNDRRRTSDRAALVHSKAPSTLETSLAFRTLLSSGLSRNRKLARCGTFVKGLTLSALENPTTDVAWNSRWSWHLIGERAADGSPFLSILSSLKPVRHLQSLEVRSDTVFPTKTRSMCWPCCWKPSK